MPDGVHARHVIAPRGQPAPRGDHGEGGSGDHLVEDPALRLAETLLALVTEDVGHGGAFALLDQRVGVDEIDAQTPRQLASEGALAAPHVTDQKKRFHRRRLKQIQLFVLLTYQQELWQQAKMDVLNMITVIKQ